MENQTSSQMEKWFYLLAEWIDFAGVEVLIALIAIAILVEQRIRYQKKITSLYHDTPLAMVMFDIESGTIRLSNRPAKQLLGIREVGKQNLYPSFSANELFFESLQHVESEYFNRVSQTWHISDVRTINVDFSGRKLQYKGRSSWLLYIVSNHDTAHTEENQSRNTARMVLDSLSELIYIKDKEGKLVDTNRAFNNFWEGRIAESELKMEGRFKGRQTQQRWTVDPQGRSCLLETTQTILLSEEGEVVGQLGISHDVTDWFKMQQDLREEMEKRKGTEKALAQRDMIVQSLLEASPDAIALYNESRVYEACNQAFADSLGITDHKMLIGKQVEDVLPAVVYESFVESDEKVMNEGVSLRYREKVLGENGESRWFDVVKSPYRDLSSDFSGVLLMARDVTDSYLTELQLEEMNHELERLSFLDGLTQIANRRRFDEQLEVIWNLHRRQNMPLTVMLCDIDFFKNFNDNYGHQKGDETLRLVAQSFQNTLSRASDCVARYGGEEFAFIIPSTEYEGAKVVAENIHTIIKELNIKHEYSKVSDRITLSIGVASMIPSPEDTTEKLIELADQALYVAKNQGRNQTRYHQF